MILPQDEVIDPIQEERKAEECVRDELKKRKVKPTMEIYRPPGRRTQPDPQPIPEQSPIIINTRKDSTSSSTSSNPSYENKQTSRLNRNSSKRQSMIITGMVADLILKPDPNKADNRSQSSKSSKDSGKPLQSNAQTPSTKVKQPKQHQQTNISSSMKDFPKKRTFGSKEFEESKNGLNRIAALKDTDLIEEFISSNMTDCKVASELGQFLVKFAVEENRVEAKNAARVAAILIDCPAGEPFHQSFLTGLKQYFECRDQLRESHFKIWTTFIHFITDTFAHIGFTYEGDLVEIIFGSFEYLLLPPTLHALRIEELESLISGLLAVGFDLERVCPERLGRLKELIRDALIYAQEPWARKMIMLLMELGASGWKLPSEANEYYFH
uniref:MIF4G domain-containing protein n=1 Tax=Rhabditophanes sp. KR3021 TaxID=114890 RepID=A0AC35TGH2_9BILA